MLLNWTTQMKKFIPAIAILVGCSSVGKVVDQPHQVATSSTKNEFYNQALKKIDQGKYSEARADLENFLREIPISSYTQVANFNIAYTLELERQFKEAAEKYRDVIVSTSKSAPRLQAYALYRLSYCLEAMGDDAQVVAVLDDVSKRSHLLASEVANAELPSRQAAAYARVGNVEQSQAYYKAAEAAVMGFRRKRNQTTQPEWLAKTLYHMGRTNLRDVTWENFEVVVRPLTKTQKFLLEAAELNHEHWSKKASEDLVAIYNNLWAVIQNPPNSSDTDEVLSARTLQQRQWEMTFEMVDLLADLNRHRLQDQDSPYVKALFSETAKVDREIKKLLARQKVGSDLTPAARKRILGQRTLRALPKKAKTQSKPTLTPPPAMTPEAKTETDPNL